MPPHSNLKRNKRAQREESTTNFSDEEEEHATKKVRWDNVDETSNTREEDEENDTSDEEASSSAKVCLATTCMYGKIGCAYYDPIRCRIYMLEDTQESPHFDLTKLLLEQSDPDIVITSSKADDDFMDILRDHMELSAGTFQIRPHKEFVPAKGRERLLSLRLLSELPFEDSTTAASEVSSNSEPKNVYDFMNRRDIGADPTLKRWNASIRIANFASVESSPLSMASVGGLLEYLARQRAANELDDGELESLEVLDIETITLSLQIFENESHASVHSEKTKEGLSLFGILNNTKTSFGRSLLRQWLFRPSLSIPVITARHDAVSAFLRPENLATSASMHNHLKGFKNVPMILSCLKNGKAKLIGWQGLVKFCFHITMLRDALAGLHLTVGVDVVKRLMAALDIATFRDVGAWVNEIIDWEESSNTGRVCVRPKIDEGLDNHKYILAGLGSVLSKVAEQISSTIPPNFAPSLNVSYFPQLGFLITVPLLDEWKGEEGIQVLDGWTFQVRISSAIHHALDMDTHIGDLHHAIIDREIEILEDLQAKIMQHDEVMKNACDICAELDVLLSFAEASRAYDYRRPQMVEDSVIDIVGGRHPLQELAVDIFVPNPARLVGGAGNGSYFPGYQEDTQERNDAIVNWNSVMICTGSNACGKSVYMKQIALIQYMSQIGCFVPAESATLGVVDKIFTRIQTRESVSKVQSTFMIDLNQVSLALRNCTARSLLILDEFGKGTVSTGLCSYLRLLRLLTNRHYGAGLFCGVLKELLDRGANCPKVLAATHFHEVFTDALLDSASLPITFLHMQAILSVSKKGGSADARITNGDEADVRPGESITYLYRVAEGLSLDSHAAKCAERFGVPTRVVNRARYVTQLLSAHEIGMLLDEDMDAMEKDELAEAEAVCRRFLGCELGPEAETRGVGGKKGELVAVLGNLEVEDEGGPTEP
ncbi:hypothetical protein FIBSPDRAFT_907696 [Athelia psychrophila]|uniref:DNA mismatch repair proteins mutS family domain-containing protein n=1 Tax=Athelia psychrophila TaxID=1759441 RepID=A0A166UAI2_9AGAM|nr:hypothetical protein FIBSPDRAFT_907696 [Fibularhizoctonia sp. CBS 109695]